MNKFESKREKLMQFIPYCGCHFDFLQSWATLSAFGVLVSRLYKWYDIFASTQSAPKIFRLGL